MADNALVRIGFGLLPSIAILVAYLTTRDMLIEQCLLLVTMLLGIVVFDKAIRPIDWERQYGKELSHWMQNLNLILCWLFSGMALGFVLWITVYSSGFLINIKVEALPFPFCPTVALRWLYWIVVMTCHSLVIPVAEEFYYRCLIGDGKIESTLLNNPISAFCYGLHYFMRYFFFFPESPKVPIWTGILMLFFGVIQNIAIKSGLLICCAFNIGISLNYPLKVAWLENVWTKLRNPRLFILYEAENIWV